MEIAAQGAQILKRDFDVEDVILFGSVLSEKLFHERSDIDMAVRGLAEEDYYRAVARLLSLSSEFDVDLVRMEWASPRLLERIAEGVKL